MTVYFIISLICWLINVKHHDSPARPILSSSPFGWPCSALLFVYVLSLLDTHVSCVRAGRVVLGNIQNSIVGGLEKRGISGGATWGWSMRLAMDVKEYRWVHVAGIHVHWMVSAVGRAIHNQVGGQKNGVLLIDIQTLRSVDVQGVPFTDPAVPLSTCISVWIFLCFLKGWKWGMPQSITVEFCLTYQRLLDLLACVFCCYVWTL